MRMRIQPPVTPTQCQGYTPHMRIHLTLKWASGCVNVHFETHRFVRRNIRAERQKGLYRGVVPLLARPMQCCFARGITSVNLCMKTHQQLHQVLAPLFGRDE
jgi:hypothetical protein